MPQYDIGRIKAAASLIQLVEETQGRPRKQGDQWLYSCTFHTDKTPSMLVDKEHFHCFGCDEHGDIFDYVEKTQGLTKHMAIEAVAMTYGIDPIQEVDIIYPYTDATGTLLYEVVRKPDKKFLQRRPAAGGGYDWGLGDVERVLFNLPNVVRAVDAGDPVWICEGEKDALAIGKQGLTSTTCSGGTKNWSKTQTSPLSGAVLNVVVDRDAPGYLHGLTILHSDVGVSVAVWEPIEGKDVSDHLAAGHKMEDLKPISEQELKAKAGGGEVKGLAIHTVGGLKALGHEKVDWIWEGYVAPGAITLFAAREKTGKSTLIFHAIGAIQKGLVFCGQSTRRAKILFLSEESPQTIVEKCDEAQLSNTDLSFATRGSIGKVGWHDLPEDAAVEEADLVIVDTWAAWSSLTGENENSAGAIQESMLPILSMAGSGKAVLLIHHLSKNTEEARGSTALTGAVDIIMKLLPDSSHGNRRLIRSVGRFNDTPSISKIQYEGRQGYKRCSF